MTIFTPRAGFTRPADTTAYAANDLVANSTTPGSVTPLTFAMPGLRGGIGAKLVSARILKSAASATLATFALHFFGRAQVVTAGDNGAFQVVNGTDYLGSLAADMATLGSTHFSAGGLWKLFQPTLPLPLDLPAGNVYAYLVAGAAYVPASAETFAVQLGIET